MVEAAMVTPIFVLFVFAIFEFGLLLRSHVTLTTASGQAARAASAAASSPTADFLILQTVAHGMQAQGSDVVQRIVVFKATGPGDAVPSHCLTASVTGLCNHYTMADTALPYADDHGARTAHWGCEVGARDEAWCPLDRETDIDGDGPDHVGVYIESRHQYLTGFIGTRQLLNETTVVRLEPRSIS